jgi:hypothetical protein
MHEFFRNPARALSLVIAAMCVYLWMHGAAAQLAQTACEPVSLRSDTEVATAGYFQLSWNADEPIRLVESKSSDFTDSSTIYTGSDSGRTVSGRRNGELFYRLESAGSAAVLSQPLRVVVAHHPLSRALSFFGVGAFVFIATLALIVIGSLRSDEPSGAA